MGIAVAVMSWTSIVIVSNVEGFTLSICHRVSNVRVELGTRLIGRDVNVPLVRVPSHGAPIVGVLVAVGVVVGVRVRVGM